MVSPIPDATAMIEFVDPCPDPEFVLSAVQTNPPNYFYTGQAPSMQFSLSPFTVDPSICNFQYSCQIIAGHRFDLC